MIQKFVLSYEQIVTTSMNSVSIPIDTIFRVS